MTKLFPTMRVADDHPRGYRIINVADHNAEIHSPWPPVEPEPETDAASEAAAAPEKSPETTAPTKKTRKA